MEQSICEGERYTALHGEAMRLAVELMRDDSSSVLESMIERLKQFNEAYCSPPKHVGEIYEIAYRCMKDAARSLGDESNIKRDVLGRLSKHFNIYQEVWGTHWSGKRMRIDAIITPKDTSRWKTKSPRFGIEFKNFRGFNPSMDMKDYTKWWSQCHDYAETNFDGHGYVVLFSYNGFSHYRKRAGNRTTAAFAVRFWGRLNVGEITPEDLTFVMNGTNKIWSESRGVIDGARISVEPRHGSR